MEENDEFKVSKKLLKTLTADTRTEILKNLQLRPMTASELSRKLNKHVTTVSEHLDVLKNSDLIERVERPGRKWIYYRLTKPGETIVAPSSHRWAFVLVAILLAFSGWYIFSVNAYPGQFLYGSKRLIENFQILLTPDNLEKAKLHVQYAEKRLEETKFIVSKEESISSPSGGMASLPAKSFVATGSSSEKVVEGLTEYQNEMNQAKKEIEIARTQNRNVEPVVEDIDESTVKHTAMLQNIANKAPELKEEIQPILDTSQRTVASITSELCNSTY
jgi:DNA-binding transcriptional ArsR family regulator